MKKSIAWLIKSFIALLLALVLVSGISFFYYNFPVHYTNTTGATDYFLNKNQLSFCGTEGFAYTKTDEQGFVNTFSEKKDQIDVLVMGSSHTESLNVNSDENFTYLLNQKFKENGQNKYAYNIGVSGHDLMRCLNNFENAVKTYCPSEYIVIETTLIEFSEDSLKNLNNGTYDKLPSYDSGLAYYLQKVDFFRLAYAQITNFIEKDKKEKTKNKDDSRESIAEKEDLTLYKKLVETALEKVSKTANDNNCKVVIVYSPQAEIDYYGNMIKNEYTEKQKLFADTCAKYNIKFIDMISAYDAMYKDVRYLPQGFSNIAIGKGHLNEYGHKCIAQEVYKVISEG